jgi:regulatory protein
MAGKEKRPLSREEILEKIRHFCAYQERSRLQVMRKLQAIGCGEEDVPAMLEMLAEGNYLNEARFVSQYVRSRASAKGWGPAKIAMALHRETGANHREEIRQDEDSKARALEKLKKDLLKKRGELDRKQDPQVREKLLRFCLSRGFGMEDSLRILDNP